MKAPKKISFQDKIKQAIKDAFLRPEAAKLARTIEAKYKVSGNLTEIVTEFMKAGRTEAEILETVEGAHQYNAVHGFDNLELTLSFFLSCLKFPKEPEQQGHDSSKHPDSTNSNN